jgi:glyoxylase-like metal-dependent hydrolase (beta-lactamase superfamily II)
MIRRLRYGPIIEWRFAADHPLLSALSKTFWSSCYLIDGLLIDCASPGCLPQFRTFISTLSAEERPTQCVITHWHEDHSAGARWLSEDLALPVYAHELTAQKLSQGFSYPFYRKWAWGGGLQPASRIQRIGASPLRTASGAYCFDWLCLPGHERGMIGLIERRQGWAFISDAAMPRYRMLFRGSGVEENIEQIHGSLERLLDFIAPCEKNVQIFLAGRDVVSEGQAFLRSRLAEIEQLHATAHAYRRQGLSLRGIVQSMFKGECLEAYLTCGALSRANLIRSLLQWPSSGFPSEGDGAGEPAALMGRASGAKQGGHRAKGG